jgi:hypothetical protein
MNAATTAPHAARAPLAPRLASAPRRSAPSAAARAPAAPGPSSPLRRRPRGAIARLAAADGGAGEPAAASEAAAAAAPPPPPPAPAPPPPPPAHWPAWRRLLARCAGVLLRALWPLLAVHIAADAAAFLLQRGAHRAANAAAAALVPTAAAPGALGNPWWLSSDPALANFETGYQAVAIAASLLAFPAVVAIKSVASAATVLIARGGAGWAAGAAPRVAGVPLWRPLAGLRAGFAAARALAPDVRALWPRVYAAELLCAAAVVPLQFASLAVVTLPLTLPLILSLQAAAPAAAVEGLSGVGALKRSRTLLARGRLRWHLAAPFLGLVAAQRGLEAARNAALTAMPPRYFKELVELPLLLVVAAAVAAALLARLQDVLPAAAYAEAVELEAAAAAAAKGGDVSGGDAGGAEPAAA